GAVRRRYAARGGILSAHFWIWHSDAIRRTAYGIGCWRKTCPAALQERRDLEGCEYSGRQNSRFRWKRKRTYGISDCGLGLGGVGKATRCAGNCNRKHSGMGTRRTKHLLPRSGWKFAGTGDARILGDLLTEDFSIALR